MRSLWNAPFCLHFGQSMVNLLDFAKLRLRQSTQTWCLQNGDFRDSTGRLSVCAPSSFLPGLLGSNDSKHRGQTSSGFMFQRLFETGWIARVNKAVFISRMQDHASLESNRDLFFDGRRRARILYARKDLSSC